MKVVKLADYDVLSNYACKLVTNVLNKEENPVIGLATGSTPEGLYDCLIEQYKQGLLNFENVTTFNLDEYVGLDENHPGSYRYYMREKLFDHINIKLDNVHMPSGTEEDLKKHCEEYEQKIKNAGQIDLQILGVGVNGHIGFNEPGTPFSSKTHVVELKESTRKVNSRFFNHIDEVPNKAVTMGIETIMSAKEVVLLISGEAKQETVRAFMESDISEDFPASVLKQHPNFKLVVDEEAYALVK